MASKDLRKRAVWQDYSGAHAGAAERSFYDVFQEAFSGTELSIRRNPNEFSKTYVDVELSKSVLSEIYCPDSPITTHGVWPDYAIDNLQLRKTLYVEVKRQDGWVEGKPRSAGRGNAHERSCKFFTPGLLRTLRKHGRLGEDVLPFWTVFQGDITRDPCRVREITLWFDTFTAHFFMWRNQKDPMPLLKHFDAYLKRLLL
ncbi:MAG: MunI family type II restriction endonuclease [Nitrospira sp.]|nr:MunI family type II restriction endonuclease [Nitrospira sp.]